MIYFKKVRWQNFLSTGNQWTEIHLNKAKSTLVVGENGAGKSTMLDAISFSLYGKPYRNINKPQLVNSITNKGLLVEIEFTTKGKEYLVRRGIKPGKFEIYCDDKLVDQNANVREYQEYLEKQVLKLNHKSFTQIVVIGSANFVPFMQMKVWERRDVIEDLLDIEIFTKMYTGLKERISANKDAIVEAKYKIDLLEEKITLTRKHMNEIASMKQTNRAEKEKQITEHEQALVLLASRHAELVEKNTELQNSIADMQSLKDKKKKLDSFKHKLNYKVNDIQRDIEFFNTSTVCSTCTQPIDDNHKACVIENNQTKKEKIIEGLEMMQKEYDEIDARFDQIMEVQEQISNLTNEMMDISTDQMIHRNGIKALNADLVRQPVEEDVSDLQETQKILSQQKETHERLCLEKETYEIATSLLKDGGIKAKIIKQYVPIINKLMNKYLAAMEFFVQFELDEQFNEKIKSRFRDEFSYDSFSEGEKMRIDLSLLFTWRAVAKLRNSITTNLLIMDEVFDSSLDNTGTDEFLKLITQLTTDTNVFVISHKGDQLFDKFHSNIRFEKVKNFSQIAA
jgi:DNA repair exonuclease SbcCD ATPase subunit